MSPPSRGGKLSMRVSTSAWSAMDPGADDPPGPAPGPGAGGMPAPAPEPGTGGMPGTPAPGPGAGGIPAGGAGGMPVGGLGVNAGPGPGAGGRPGAGGTAAPGPGVGGPGSAGTSGTSWRGGISRAAVTAASGNASPIGVEAKKPPPGGGGGTASGGTGRVCWVHWTPSQNRSVDGLPAGSSYQPAGGLGIGGGYPHRARTGNR